MANTLLLEVVQGALDPLDQALREHAKAGHAPAVQVEEAEQIMRACGLIAQSVVGLRQLTHTISAKGIERRQFAAHLNSTLTTVARAMGSFAAARDLLRRAVTSEEGAADVAKLDSFLHEAEQFRQELTALLVWVETPFPPLPIDLHAELERPTGERSFINLDEFRAQVQAGDGSAGQ
jgi:hypothetical protein